MLDKTYAPSSLEARWRALWQHKGTGADRAGGKPPKCLILPPPNVTGNLHIGHALTFTLQDIWVRFWRMQGFDVLAQPGTDHAGIATQMLVERHVIAEGGTRHALGREAFLERVWAFKEQSGGAILEQLQRLGMSADWSRTKFTLDPEISAAVRRVFVTLHREGLIYRSKRLVNWDPVLKTAISDLEVQARDIPGHLWRIRYPLEGGGAIEVATTRPETLFGDVAVAVHPDDARYQSLIGRMAHLPLTGRQIPLIADPHVDPEKGTGAVKITPAHDFNDFEVGQAHGLEMPTILDETGHLTGNVPAAFHGMERFKARAATLAALEAEGLLIETQAIVHAVPHGDRSGAVLEPRLTDQWFLNAKVLAEPALAAWERGDLKFVPENYGEIYADWMRRIEPWCLSRQLWWGHAIPAWYGPDGHPFVAESEAEALGAARAHYGRDVVLTPDDDVLDTWFSSALWPFTTLGWPEQTPELARYYPSDVLVTGWDILFFWVARMVMMGLYFMKDVPFRTVVIHGLVRDAQRQKMSKTKGNVVDPLEIMDTYGTDALRLTLALSASPGRDIAFDITQVEAGRNFITKLWNATRFCLMKGCHHNPAFNPLGVTLPLNQWLVSETGALILEVGAAQEAQRFFEAAQRLTHFVRHVFCDWAIELAKPLLDEGVGGEGHPPSETQETLGWVLGTLLRMLHPFVPFVTEELWAALVPNTEGLFNDSWPSALSLEMPECFTRSAEETRWLMAWVTELRQLRADLNIPYASPLMVKVFGVSPEDVKRFERFTLLFKRLVKIESVTLEAGAAPVSPELSAEGLLGGLMYRVPLEGVLDVDAERARLGKALEKVNQEAEKLKARFEAPDFRAKAPATLVAETEGRLQELGHHAEQLQGTLSRLTLKE